MRKGPECIYDKWNISVVICHMVELQKYLTFGSSKSFTLFLSHSLAIETARYNKPFNSAEERYCKYCLDQVENEMSLYVCDFINWISRYM